MIDRAAEVIGFGLTLAAPFYPWANLADWPISERLAASATFLGITLAFVFGRTAYRLASDAEPKLRVTGPHEYTLPKNPNGKARKRGFYLQVENAGGATLSNISVQMVSMFNRNGQNSKEIGRRFKSHLQTPGNDDAHFHYTQEFSAQHGEMLLFDIAHYAEIAGDTHVCMDYALEAQASKGAFRRVPLKTCPHIITARVLSNAHAKPVELKMKFFVDGGGIFRMERE